MGKLLVWGLKNDFASLFCFQLCRLSHSCFDPHVSSWTKTACSGCWFKCYHHRLRKFSRFPKSMPPSRQTFLWIRIPGPQHRWRRNLNFGIFARTSLRTELCNRCTYYFGLYSCWYSLQAKPRRISDGAIASKGYICLSILLPIGSRCHPRKNTSEIFVFEHTLLLSWSVPNPHFRHWSFTLKSTSFCFCAHSPARPIIQLLFH